jgi:hypothetical protein
MKRKNQVYIIIVFLISCTIQAYINKAVNNGKVFDFWRYYKRKRYTPESKKEYYFTKKVSKPSILGKVKEIINEY